MNPISPLQLRDYVLEYLLVESNPEFKGEDGATFESKLGVDFDFKKSQEGRAFRVDLDVQLNPTAASFSAAPYRIRIKTRTVVEFEKEFPDKDIPNLLGPNGLAMAYGIARGIVGQATGTSVHGKIMLPTVNFVELLKEKLASKRGGNPPKLKNHSINVAGKRSA